MGRLWAHSFARRRLRHLGLFLPVLRGFGAVWSGLGARC